MSYYVEYSPELKRKYPFKKKIKKRSTAPLIILMLISVAVYVSVRTDIARNFIPGNSDVTTAAFSNLVDNVKSGEPIRQSVLSFCQEIILNGT